MNKIKSIEKPLKKIDEKLSRVYSENDVFNAELLAFINGSEKRIRSALVLLYLNANDREISEEILQVLTAGELIHNASLLHDDVIDNAEIRRGQPVFARRFSNNISILSGDLLLSFACSAVQSLNNRRIQDIFANCTKKMAEAEITQYFLRGKIPDIQTYLKICEGKTAALFEALFKSTAILSGTDENKAEKFARDFGILFQLKNDVEKNSAEADKHNKIYTAKDILGIEKMIDLTDNYLEGIRRQLERVPDSIYKKDLEGLLEKL